MKSCFGDPKAKKFETQVAGSLGSSATDYGVESRTRFWRIHLRGRRLSSVESVLDACSLIPANGK